MDCNLYINSNWGLCFVQMKIKFEDIIFWLLIAGIIAIALWLLHGSPTEVNAIIAVAIFVATSEILLWKTFFNIDKRTSVSFEKVKNTIDKNHLELKNLINRK